MEPPCSSSFAATHLSCVENAPIEIYRGTPSRRVVSEAHRGTVGRVVKQRKALIVDAESEETRCAVEQARA